MAQGEEKEYMKTAELVEKTGLTRQIIYEYINFGLIREAKRTEAGHRLFDERSVTEVKLIHQLSESGYTLRAIRDIFIEGQGRRRASAGKPTRQHAPRKPDGGPIPEADL